MTTYIKFNCFVEDLAEKKHDLSSDTLRILWTNTAPDPGDTIVDTTTSTCTVKSVSNAAEIAAGNGYTKKGGAVTITSSAQTAGTYKLVGNDFVWTATGGGSFGPARYAVLYNDTAGTTSTRPVIAWWDKGVSVTPTDPDTLTADLDQTNGILQIA